MTTDLDRVADDYATCAATYAVLVVESDRAAALREWGFSESASEGVWELSSERDVQSKDLRRHLRWLRERIAPFAEEVSGMRPCVVCPWWMEHMGGPTLSAVDLQALSDLGAELVFDFRVVQPEALPVE